MKSLFSAELYKLAALVIIGALVGNLLHNIWLGLSAGLVVYIFFQLRYYRRFNLWLANSGPSVQPLTNSFWSTIMDQVSRLLNGLRAEQRLLEADVEYFKQSFQALESAVVVIDKRGRIDWCNLASKRLLGTELDRDRGQLLVNLIRAPEMIQYLDSQYYVEPLSINSPISLDIRLEVQATVFRQDYILIFARNISELFKLENMRRDFIANVSHELRTPLTVITGYLETLSDHTADLPEVWDKAVRQMLEQSQRMDSMVEDLIWLSRLESLPADQNDLELVPLDGLLTSVVSDAQLTHSNKTIKFVMDTAGYDALSTGFSRPMQIRGSYAELRSAFSNLIQNALKYTPQDGEVIVDCYPYRDSLIIKVTDTGEGIDPIHIPRLTERFYRVDSSRTSTTGGTGLGLAIVKHVLARHEAELEITSKVGVGSKFSCVFPLSRLLLDG